MRRRRFRGLAVILAAFLVCGALPWASAQIAGSVVPGAWLAAIPLGAPIPEVVRRFGAPSAVRLVGTDGTLAYVFGRYGITAYARDNVVIALSTTNSVVGSAQGIGMGAPEEAVIAAFGAPRVAGIIEGFRGIVYESLGIAFGLDRHSVAVIMIFAPHASAAPSPPAPELAPSVTSQGLRDGAEGSAVDTPASAETTPTAPAQTARAASVETAQAAPGAPVPTPQGGAAVPIAILPDVSNLRPFTAETRFLSLAGYLRYVIYTMTRQWVTAADAFQQVVQQVMMRVVDGTATP